MVTFKAKHPEGERDKQKGTEPRFGLSRVSGVDNRRPIVLNTDVCTAFTGGLRILDTLILKAGESNLEIVFLGIDDKKKLDFMLFEKGKGGWRLFLEFNRKKKIWSGELKDRRRFSVWISNLRVNPRDPLIVAKVDVYFAISKK
jgi:hypothetical protein